ncbi:hypothetical protein [Sphingomonas sp.]|uniref:hypothetical protein n=1 Tax=Sphingomonas sp. TaxID=28214 RepID=UPI003D6D3332
MSRRLARFRKVAALGQAPTPFRRLAAAAVAGGFAFALTQLLLGTIWGAGWDATLFSSTALAVAAAVAAITMNRARAFVYGVLAALWLLFEGIAVLIGAIAAGVG